MKQKVSWTIDTELVKNMETMAEKQGISTSALVNAVLKGGQDATGELVNALDMISVPDLLEMLIKEGKKKRK